MDVTEYNVSMHVTEGHMEHILRILPVQDMILKLI